MMNGEGPSVPITTLAGIQSLTDLLLELPLPTPLPGSTGNRSLLSHLRDSDEARQLLNNAHESFLIPPLVDALNRTATDNVEVKDGYYGGPSHSGQTSQLLQFLLSRSPNIFKGVVPTAPTITAEHHPSTSQWIQRQCAATTLHPQQQQQQQPYTPVQMPSCPPHPSSPQFTNQSYQIEQSQVNRHIHSKQIPVSQQKAPLSNYPQYGAPVVTTEKFIGQQPPAIVQNAISQAPTPSPHTPTALQESQPFYESPIVNKYTSPPTCAPHSYSNGSCADGVSIVSPAKVAERTENHLPDTPQSVTSSDTGYTGFLKTRGATRSSSSAATQPVHPSQIVTSQPQQSCNSKNTSHNPPSTSSVRAETINSSQSSLVNSKDSIGSMCNLVDSYCDSKNTCAVEDRQLNQEEQRKSATASRRKSSEPVVILDKLSIEDQALAQKSVKEFTKKVVSGSVDDMHKSPKQRNCESIGKEYPRRKPSVSEEPEASERGVSKRRTNTSSVKEHSPQKSSSKRHCDSGYDEEYRPGKGSSNSSTSLGERVKKRRRSSQLANYTESSASKGGSDNSSDETPISQIKVKKTKIKKVKKEPKLEQLSTEDLMDTNTYQHFSRTVEAIFDSMEDLDFSADIDEDAECPAEALIPMVQLQELCNEAAKLKMLQAMNQFPPERLVRLLTILERNVLDGAKILPVQSADERDEEEAKLWLELTMERVMRSADASLTALYIMTSPNMPEKVFLEDVIERIVLFLKFQLQNTVFPVFDPAYRIDPKSKDGYVGNIKQKRAHAHKVKEKSIIQLYNKLHEAVGLLAELLNVQTLTDTIILQVSTLGVSPFFVEGVNELQLNVLRLVTTVFAKYDKHRQLILEDILASIARLPTSKRSLRNYRLNSEEHIQMLTALVLQLIHSVVRLPEPENNIKSNPYLLEEEESKGSDVKDAPTVDKDVLIITSYEAAVRTAINFLSVFLKKCGTKNEEMDYRPLFENFVQDLLSTVNKPEWPASELLLSLLGRLLVQNFSNKGLDMTLRVASLDYLGVVAARLRKDAVMSQLRKETINEVIKQILGESSEVDVVQYKSKKSKHKQKPTKKDETQILQKVLLQYLDANVHSDPALQFARKFYIAQWYRDAAATIRSDKVNKEKTDENEQQQARPNNSKPARGTKPSRHKNRRSSQVNYEAEVEEDEDVEKEETKADTEVDENNVKLLALAEERKRFLLSVIKLEHLKKSTINQVKHIEYSTAELISSFLASKRPFSQSFDIYLSQILRVLNETAVAVRTKAMKCLTLVVEADPSILARLDMQRGVHGRLLDQSTSVREAAVDLVGKFILIRPELTSQYYEMLTDRILDTGVSVRKRVIKILKDVCLEQPDFPKIPEICVKIIRRVNDEEGIKKLVGEVFQSMWFSPVSDREPKRILQKVKNITHVVAACKDSGLEWFEQLLMNLLKNKEDANYKGVIKSCKQIVDCLVENVLQLEESSQEVEGSGASQNLVACLTTLHLFCKIYPHIVVPHVNTIQPYLSMRCNTQADYHVLQNVARTLELVVPLIEHPSELFLAQIEEDMVKLILRHGMMILPSCVSCLGAVVNRVTHNYQLVRDCFQKFFVVLLGFKKELEKQQNNPLLLQRPKLLRSLFTVGLFCRHFDFTSVEPTSETSGQEPLKDRVFDVILYFTRHEDEDIRHKALTGLGFMMIRHYEFMLGKQVKDLYYYLLSDPDVSASLKCQVLKNLTVYLLEEEARMIQKDAEWSKVSKDEDLKEMGDVSSGMASTVIQVYLKQVLETVLHTQVSVRKIALQVIHLILGQGLVHPVQIVPYLICMGSDDDQVLRTKADQLLQEIEKKYPGFVQMKALSGVRMSYKMQQLIRTDDKLIRGSRTSDSAVSRNGFLYSVIRGTRQNRRAFLLSLLKLFDEQARTPLSELLYIADNIVNFPFQVQDEPLFIMHQIDIMLSVSGSNLLQSFREALLPSSSHAEEDDDDDDFDAIYQRLPENTSVLQECMVASQACLLLLFIKQTLKEMYGFTDNKIQQYSPNEAAKVYEKTMNRKVGVKFKPNSVINFIKGEDNHDGTLDEAGKKKLIQQYLNFKQLMLTIDPADDDDEDQSNRKTVPASKLLASVLQAGEGNEEETVTTTTSTSVTTNSSVVNTCRTPEKVSRCKSPGSSRAHSRSKLNRSNPLKEKKKKEKHRKKRKRIVNSNDSSDDDDSDPDYMEDT